MYYKVQKRFRYDKRLSFTLLNMNLGFNDILFLPLLLLGYQCYDHGVDPLSCRSTDLQHKGQVPKARKTVTVDNLLSLKIHLILFFKWIKQNNVFDL